MVRDHCRHCEEFVIKKTQVFAHSFVSGQSSYDTDAFVRPQTRTGQQKTSQKHSDYPTIPSRTSSNGGER